MRRATSFKKYFCRIVIIFGTITQIVIVVVSLLFLLGFSSLSVAAFRTGRHFVPASLPLFAPRKGTITSDANLAWKIFFLDTSRHGVERCRMKVSKKDEARCRMMESRGERVFPRCREQEKLSSGAKDFHKALKLSVKDFSVDCEVLVDRERVCGEG